MTGPASVPIRDPRFAKPQYMIQRRGDGAITIANQAPHSLRFSTTNAALDYWAQAAPDRVWLAQRSGAGWRRMTFSEAHQSVAVLAGALAGLGVGPGRPVMMLARNEIGHALVTYAAMRLGAAAAPVSPQYGLKGADPSRLAHAVSLIAPACIYVDDAAIFAVALAAPALKGVAVIAGANARLGDHPLDALLREGAAVGVVASPNHIAKLLLTSGSTGRPKAVICTHRNIVSNGAQIEACYDDPEPPVMVNCAPWSHSMGANAILHMTLHRGGTLYIDAGQPVPGRFNETLRNLRDVVTTSHYLVPAGWNLLVSELERDDALARTFFAQARVLQYGGAGLAQSVADRVVAVAERVVGERVGFTTGYGSTETGPTACNVHWPNLYTGMVGMPVPGTTLKLAPHEGKLEVRVRGPQVSPGYYDASRAAEGAAGADPAGAIDEEGFFSLGDAARWVDPNRLEQGLEFDGRLAENFKLSTGAFVTAGALRIAALSAIGGAALDAVVCGEGRDGVGLMLFADPAIRERLGEAALRDEIAAGLSRLNSEAVGIGGRVRRALILSGLPDPGSGEITDKGYINQAMARARRAHEIERLFAGAPNAEIIQI